MPKAGDKFIIKIDQESKNLTFESIHNNGKLFIFKGITQGDYYLGSVENYPFNPFYVHHGNLKRINSDLIRQRLGVI